MVGRLKIVPGARGWRLQGGGYDLALESLAAARRVLHAVEEDVADGDADDAGGNPSAGEPDADDATAAAAHIVAVVPHSQAFAILGGLWQHHEARAKAHHAKARAYKRAADRLTGAKPGTEGAKP